MNLEELEMLLAAVIPEIVKGMGGGREAKDEHGGGRRILEEKMFNRSTGWISLVGRKSYTRSGNITSG